jgi:hypothetical protein
MLFPPWSFCSQGCSNLSLLKKRLRVAEEVEVHPGCPVVEEVVAPLVRVAEVALHPVRVALA